MPRLAYSLKRQIWVLSLWIWITAALLATLMAYWYVGQTTAASFDRVLADDARALGQYVHWTDGKAWFAGDDALAQNLVFDSLEHARFALRHADGTLLLGSDQLLAPQGGGAADATAALPTFSDLKQGQVQLRVVSLLLGGRGGDEAVWVIVAESDGARKQVSRDIALGIFMPAALIGFVLAPLLGLGIRFGLHPAQRISDELSRRGRDDLTPLSLVRVPQELRVVVKHTNGLLQRLSDALVEQTRLVADAAHQLQTPIAGTHLLVKDLVRTHQADPRSPVDDRVLKQLEQVSERSTRLVRQLLAHARAQHLQPPDLQPVVMDAFLQALAERQHATVAAQHKALLLDVADGCRGRSVPASPLFLGEALDNLLDNACRYGGHTVTLFARAATDGGVELGVRDDGPRLPDEVLANLFRPFWRHPSQRGGSGLGLSIVQRLGQAMQARVEARRAAPSGGLEVSLAFGPEVGR